MAPSTSHAHGGGRTALAAPLRMQPITVSSVSWSFAAIWGT